MYKSDIHQRVRRITTTIRVGDYVYLEPPEGSKSRTAKLAPLGVDPYRFISNDSPTFVIAGEGKVERMDARRETYVPTPRQGNPPQRYSDYKSKPSELSSKKWDGPTYVLENATDYCEVAGGIVEFKVQWYEYLKETW